MVFSGDVDVDSLASNAEGDLQEFLVAEQQKAQFQAQVMLYYVLHMEMLGRVFVVSVTSYS